MKFGGFFFNHVKVYWSGFERFLGIMSLADVVYVFFSPESALASVSELLVSGIFGRKVL